MRWGLVFALLVLGCSSKSTDTSTCNQAETSNLCCCQTDMHADLVCGADGHWTCAGYYQLYSGVDCHSIGGPCSFPVVDVVEPWHPWDAGTWGE